MSDTGDRVSALSSMFYPKSVAVIGASANPAKLGYACVDGILRSGYRGAIYPVNPNADSILGIKCIASASELPENVDLAIVMLPADKVPDVLKTLAGKSVKGALIPAGGFAETGARGVDLQRAIESICAESSMRVLGPNIPGFINADASLVATLAGGPVGSGPLAIVSQAGSVGYALIRGCHAMAIPFGRFICLGNQADISDADVLEFLSDDAGIRAIAVYIESVKDGRRFVEVARKVSARKPIIVLKGGRTAAGLGAIFSHTASISSPERVYRAAFRKSGVVEADSLRSLGMLTFALAHQPCARGTRIAIVTSLAGMGVIASDACEKVGLHLPAPSHEVRLRLSEVLPPMASTRNPVDLTGDVTPAMLAQTVAILAASDEYDGIIPLVMGVPGSEAFGNIAYARALEPAIKGALTNGVVCSIAWVMDEAGGNELRQVREVVHGLGVPVSEMPEDAVHVMNGLVARLRLTVSSNAEGADLTETPRSWADGIAKLAGNAQTVLTEHITKGLLEAAGVPVASSRLANSAGAATEHARALGFPVALKVQSRSVTHKSGVGGVALGLRDEADVAAAFANLVSRFSGKAPDAVLDGISVQPMIEDEGVELVCGISEDAQFGKYVLVGLGGVTVEVLEDFSLRLLPVNEEDVESMLSELRSSALLCGFRGTEPVNRPALVAMIVKLCDLAQTPQVAELEVNPLLATPKRPIALDARLRLRDAMSAPSATREHANVVQG